MADEDDLLVTISGPALALLLYENSRIIEQFGFLLGRVLIYVTKKVTDSDRDVEQIKYHINIESLVAYPKGELFFNSQGQINEKKLYELLGEKHNSVVGWYHHRDITTLQPSFRDYKLHNELSKFFGRSNDLLTKENFIMCLLNSEKSRVGGTHKFKQLIMRKNSSDIFIPISLKINNLGADATRPDGSDYKLKPQHSSSNSDDGFEYLLKSVKGELVNKSNVEKLHVIQNKAEKFLNQVVKEVAESDKRISELECQLEKRRNNKHHEIFEKKLLELDVRKMDVDPRKSVARSDSKTPDGLDSETMFDSPKSQVPSSSNVKLGTARSFNLDYTQNIWKRESSPIDRDISNFSSSQSSSHIPSTSTSALRGSPPIDNTRFSNAGSSGDNCYSPNTMEKNRNLRGLKHRNDSKMSNVIIPSSDNESDEL